MHGECGPGERVTPTGAAILAALVSSAGQRPAMQLIKVGSGAGSKDFSDCPNILRAFLGRVESEQKEVNEVEVVECNIDDSTPELLGYAMERLLEEGALDVFFTPIQMKKNRPATQLSFLCRPEQLEILARLVLSETSTIGLRHYPVRRITLERRIEERETTFGPMRFKLVFDNGRLPRERGMSLQDVLRIVTAEMNSGGRGDVKPS